MRGTSQYKATRFNTGPKSRDDGCATIKKKTRREHKEGRKEKKKKVVHVSHLWEPFKKRRKVA